MTNDTSEQGLEELICKVLTGKACVPSTAGEISVPAANYFGVGWSCSSYRDYDREYGVENTA